jgi:hypothetical protein
MRLKSDDVKTSFRIMNSCPLSLETIQFMILIIGKSKLPDRVLHFKNLFSHTYNVQELNIQWQYARMHKYCEIQNALFSDWIGSSRMFRKKSMAALYS